eukprot:gene27125-32769_t
MRIADLRKGIVRERADANYMSACVAHIFAGVIKSGECDFTYLIPEPQEGNVGSMEQPYHYDIEVEGPAAAASTNAAATGGSMSPSGDARFHPIHDIYNSSKGTFLPNERLRELTRRAGHLVEQGSESADLREIEYSLRSSLVLPDSFQAAKSGSESQFNDNNLKSLMNMIVSGCSDLVVKKEGVSFDLLLASPDSKPEYRIESLSTKFPVIASECKGLDDSISEATPQGFQFCANSALHMRHKGISLESCVVPGQVMAGEHLDHSCYLVPRSIHLTKLWELAAWLVALREFALQSVSLIIGTQARVQEGRSIPAEVNNRIVLSSGLFFKPIFSKAKSMPAGVEGDWMDVSSCRSRLRIILTAYERLWRCRERLEFEYALFPIGVMSFPTTNKYSFEVCRLLQDKCSQSFVYTESEIKHVPLLIFHFLDDKVWKNVEKPPEKYREHYIVALRQVVELLNEAGVAHMDLRPSNIMWKVDDSKGRLDIRVVDFEDACLFGAYIDYVDTLGEDARYPVAPSAGQHLAGNRRVLACANCNIWFLQAISCFLRDQGKAYTTFSSFMKDFASQFQEYLAIE